jgi:DNA mismatch repair ATPase MutS
MQADKTTLGDLSLFTHDEEHSVFHHLNFTRTVGGKQWLHYFLINPFDNIHKITETQNVLRRMLEVHAHWSNTLISNGTIMVMEKFYETSIQEIPSHPNFISSLFYRAFNSSDFSLLKYSLKHFVDFVIGLDEIVRLLSSEDNPSLLQTPLERIKMLLNRPALQTLLTMGKTKDLSMQEILSNGHFIRRHFKPEALELIDIYGKLDAYYSLATACKQFKFSFPSFIDSKQPIVFAKQLYHPLIPLPVAYDISLSPEKNFLFLTGAEYGRKKYFY